MMPSETLISRHPKIPYLLISLTVLVLDQWSKWLVEARIPLHKTLPVIDGLLNLTHIKNTGVAFGLFASRGELTGTLILTALGLVALVVVGFYFWRTPTSEGLLLVSLGLILGGALGNLADRVSAGQVTDFIDFYFHSYHWHTFNVADSAITIGIFLMALDLIRSRPEVEEATEA